MRISFFKGPWSDMRSYSRTELPQDRKRFQLKEPLDPTFYEKLRREAVVLW